MKSVAAEELQSPEQGLPTLQELFPEDARDITLAFEPERAGKLRLQSPLWWFLFGGDAQLVEKINFGIKRGATLVETYDYFDDFFQEHGVNYVRTAVSLQRLLKHDKLGPGFFVAHKDMFTNPNGAVWHGWQDSRNMNMGVGAFMQEYSQRFRQLLAIAKPWAQLLQEHNILNLTWNLALSRGQIQGKMEALSRTEQFYNLFAQLVSLPLVILMSGEFYGNTLSPVAAKSCPVFVVNDRAGFISVSGFASIIKEVIEDIQQSGESVTYTRIVFGLLKLGWAPGFNAFAGDYLIGRKAARAPE